MIDVLHLIDTYRIGGPGKTILNSAKFIDTARFRIHVGSFTSLDASRNEFAAAVRAAGIPYLELPETGRLNLWHLGVVRRYVRDQRIAIVHPHGYRTDALAYLATRGLGVPVVTTHHGWIRNNARQDAMARLALQLCRRLDGVEVVSRRLLDELPRSVVRRGAAHVVHNGIVLDDYAPRGRRTAIRSALGVEDAQPLLGVIGRLSLEKGGTEMIEAFTIVAAAVPAAHLVFIGEGPLRASMEAHARERGLGGRVSFLGHQTPVQPYYEALDVLVSPSRTEGLSNAILEALVMRCPVVATRVGGNPEILDDGVSGLMVPAENPPALAAALLRVLREEGLRQRLIDGGVARVQDAFSFERRMREEQSFYERVLARRGQRHH